MLLKNYINILLNKDESNENEELKKNRTQNNSNRIIGTNINFNISYSNTMPTIFFIKDFSQKKELFKFVSADTRGKKFCKT